MKKHSRLDVSQRSAGDSYLAARNMKKTGMQGVAGRIGSAARKVKRTANRSYTRP